MQLGLNKRPLSSDMKDFIVPSAISHLCDSSLGDGQEVAIFGRQHAYLLGF